MIKLSCLSLFVVASGCMLGDDPGDIQSPYDSASIQLSATDAVADGVTGVTATVSGPDGAKLTLVVSAPATFAQADANSSEREKTVFLAGGQASVELVSASAGEVAVAFKRDPLEQPQLLEFHPVQLAAGAGIELELEPGVVVHRVCIAANSAVGTISRVSLQTDDGGSGSLQARAAVSADEPAGAGCPSQAADVIGWQGYAVMTWRTSAATATAELSYLGPGDTALASQSVALSGLAFPGYSVTTGAVQASTNYVTVDVAVDYLAVGELAAGPAADVTFSQRFIPSSGSSLYLGSTSGGANADIRTDEAGEVTLFFDNSSGGSYAWFVTLSGGVVVQLDDLEIL